MRKLVGVLCFAFATSAICSPQNAHRRDADITQVSLPQQGYQVISPDQAKAIYTEEQAVSDIKDRIVAIEQAIKDIQKDIRVIQDTNAVVKFIAISLEITFPGLIIAGFSIWFAAWIKKPKPRSPKLGSIQP